MPLQVYFHVYTVYKGNATSVSQLATAHYCHRFVVHIQHHDTLCIIIHHKA